MKIIYDHKIFWRQKYGGISRYFVNLFKNLEYLNINYKVISRFYKNNYLKEQTKGLGRMEKSYKENNSKQYKTFFACCH